MNFNLDNNQMNSSNNVAEMAHGGFVTIHDTFYNVKCNNVWLFSVLRCLRVELHVCTVGYLAKYILLHGLSPPPLLPPRAHGC